MLPLESDTIVPIAVLPRVPAVVPRGRGHFGKMLRDYRGSGSQDDGDGMGMGMNFAGFPRYRYWYFNPHFFVLII
jgi:hypothetical protein